MPYKLYSKTEIKAFDTRSNYIIIESKDEIAGLPVVATSKRSRGRLKSAEDIIDFGIENGVRIDDQLQIGKIIIRANNDDGSWGINRLIKTSSLTLEVFFNKSNKNGKVIPRAGASQIIEFEKAHGLLVPFESRTDLRNVYGGKHLLGSPADVSRVVRGDGRLFNIELSEFFNKEFPTKDAHNQIIEYMKLREFFKETRPDILAEIQKVFENNSAILGSLLAGRAVPEGFSDTDIPNCTRGKLSSKFFDPEIPDRDAGYNR